MELFRKFALKVYGEELSVESYLYDGVEREYTHVHAFCFVDDGHIVLNKHSRDGHYGILGGGIDEGETLEQALAREIKEEGNAELVRWGKVFVNKVTKPSDPDFLVWQVQGWADVELLPGDKIIDPGGDVVERVVVEIEKAPALLNWLKQPVDQIIAEMLAARAKAK